MACCIAYFLQKICEKVKKKKEWRPNMYKKSLFFNENLCLYVCVCVVPTSNMTSPTGLHKNG